MRYRTIRPGGLWGRTEFQFNLKLGLTPQRRVTESRQGSRIRAMVSPMGGLWGRGGFGVRPSFKFNLKLGLTPQRRVTESRQEVLGSERWCRPCVGCARCLDPFCHAQPAGYGSRDAASVQGGHGSHGTARVAWLLLRPSDEML